MTIAAPLTLEERSRAVDALVGAMAARDRGAYLDWAYAIGAAWTDDGADDERRAWGMGRVRKLLAD